LAKRKRPINVPDEGSPTPQVFPPTGPEVLSPIVRFGEAQVEPNWEIAARVEKQTLGWWDDLVVHLYFCGQGIPKWAKLSFYPPLGVFGSTSRTSEERCILITSTVSAWLPNGVREDAIPKNAELRAIRDEHTMKTSQHGASMKVPQAYFFPLLVSSNPKGSRRIEDAVTDWGRRTVGEVDFTEQTPAGLDKRYPPYTVRLPVAWLAAPGDYSIPFVLTYETESATRSSTYQLNFHIKSFWEKAWFQATIVATAVVASAVAIGQGLGYFHV
jgi:hypothetical protein